MLETSTTPISDNICTYLNNSTWTGYTAPTFTDDAVKSKWNLVVREKYEGDNVTWWHYRIWARSKRAEKEFGVKIHDLIKLYPGSESFDTPAWITTPVVNEINIDDPSYRYWTIDFIMAT